MVCGERRRDQRLSGALAIEQREHAGADNRLQHDPVPRPVRVACRARELPAQDGANLGKAVLGRRDGVGRDGDRGAPARAGLRDLLRLRDQVEVERVRLAGRGAPGDEAVLHQDQRPRRRVRRRGGRGGFREQEARLDVGHDDRGIPERVAEDGQAVALVGQREDGVRMGVIDVRGRQERVHQRLDRRVPAPRVEQGPADLVHHRGVVERFERPQAEQRAEIEGGVLGGPDGGHVDARRLDEDGGHVLAGDGPPRRLHRRVAAAVQHQRGFAPEQPARVCPERDSLSPRRPVQIDGAGGVFFTPSVQHAIICLRRPRG